MSAWSYSSLSAFETCPRRYKLTRITKVVQEPQSEAMTHGNEVHKALELSVKDNAPLPAKYKQYIPIVEAVKKSEGIKHAEIKFGLTKALAPTGFFAKDVWVRGVLDLAIVRPKSVTILDWKTGKPKEDADQLKLFAGAALALYPNVDTVRTGYAWLAYNKLDTEQFSRGDGENIWRHFRTRADRVDLAAAENNYPPKPSGLCKQWCPVPNKLCEFSGKS